jgi:Flp pilus assembly protein TadG
MSIRSPLSRPRFLRDTRGSISVEAVLIAPLLVWGMVATYVFYDGFRTKTRVQVAANSVVDMLSRQTATITPQFVDDLNNVFDALATSRGSTSIRVTSVAQTTAGEAPVIAWSHGTRGVEPAQNLSDLSGAVPPILTGEAAVVVETFGTWVPPFSLMGMESIVRLNTQVTSRPRFVPWLHFVGSTPVFTHYNPEWADPTIGYDQTAAAPLASAAPDPSTRTADPSGPTTGTTGTTSSGSTSLPDPDPMSDPNTGGTTSGSTSGSSNLGNPTIPFRQVGLWEFDKAATPNWDEAAINNQAIPVGRIGLPQWVQDASGLYVNDGGYRLDNCTASSNVGKVNNDNRRQIVIPWHDTYDLTSATVRMVFRTDGLPANNSYGYNPVDRTAWWDAGNNSAWALFSRDATNQNEPGHFSAFVMGDGSVLVRFQVWSNIQFYGEQYAGTNFFLYAPPGSVQPYVNYDMQITFDHELSMMDLYLNGERMDRRTDVPITLAGNREFWQLGGSGVYTSPGQHNTPDWERTWFCGTIMHFEIWSGAFTPGEIEYQSCGVEPYTEEWYDYYYTTFGRYPLPSDDTTQRIPARCDVDLALPQVPILSAPLAPPPAPPPPTCTAGEMANMTFNDSNTAGWSSNATDWSIEVGRFLGRFGENQGVNYTRTLDAGTSRVTLAFDLLIIDSWDGNSSSLLFGSNNDRIQLLLNGQMIASQLFDQPLIVFGPVRHTHIHSRNGVTSNVVMERVGGGLLLGFGLHVDSRWRVTVTIDNPPSDFVFRVQSTLNSPLWDESWGIDNFVMSTECSTTPGSPTPTAIVNVAIPFYWGDIYENWFVRPASVPAADWNNRPYMISGANNAQARAGDGIWGTSGVLGWDGVQLRLTNPAPGTSASALLTVGTHVIQYNFTRATTP